MTPFDSEQRFRPDKEFTMTVVRLTKPYRHLYAVVWHIGRVEVLFTGTKKQCEQYLKDNPA